MTTRSFAEPDADAVLGSRFEFTFKGTLPFFAIQDFEWARLVDRKQYLRQWSIYGEYARDITVEVEPSKEYEIEIIRRWPKGRLFKSTFIGYPTEPRSTPPNPTNVLHVPDFGMLIKFGGHEILKIRASCSTTIKVAVEDVLRTGTRMCKKCDDKLNSIRGKASASS